MDINTHTYNFNLKRYHYEEKNQFDITGQQY